ncbi:MAG: type VI secretion system tube protein Hcp [Candidatus Paracaedibacteraceae bacterium]|nr:type VI secretion system tube protein Hcp [Candidatus Paracaedibacteraceae bacterium]
MSAVIKTPDNLIDLDGLFSSTVKGFEKYGILYKIEHETSREVSGDVSSTLDSRAEVKASNVKIWIKSGSYDPTIEQHMNEGKPFKKLTVLKLINANGANQVKATLTFENVMIVRCQPDLTIPYRGVDLDGIVCVELRFSKKTNQVAEYDQGGTKKGQNVSGWDYGTASPAGA